MRNGVSVKKPRPRDVRDCVLFVGGFVGVYHELFYQGATERPYLLVVFAAMMGLPAFLRSDERLPK